MKTTKIFFLSALIAFASLSTIELAASNPFNQAEMAPPKKKCRKCVAWRPDRLFKKGQIDAIFGIGLIPTFQADKAKVNMLPLSLGLEYRFSETFSLGVVGSHSVSESRPQLIYDGSEASWENSFYQFALRPAFHISQLNDWDFYGGFSIGMNMSVVKGQTNNTETDLKEIESHLGIERNRKSVAYTGFAGARYVLMPKWTVGCEVGFGASIITLGVNYLLKD